MPDASAIRNALDIDPGSPAGDRTVDITTIGAKSGEPRRLEIWFHKIDGHWYITGTPPRQRAWYVNLVSNPQFTFHLKHGVQADLSATARPITETGERREVLGRILGGFTDPATPVSLPDMAPLEDWVQFSPLGEVSFDDLAS